MFTQHVMGETDNFQSCELRNKSLVSFTAKADRIVLLSFINSPPPNTAATYITRIKPTSAERLSPTPLLRSEDKANTRLTPCRSGLPSPAS